MYPAATPASTIRRRISSAESERHDLGLVAEFGEEHDAERGEERATCRRQDTDGWHP